MAIEDPSWPRADQWLQRWDSSWERSVAEVAPDLLVHGVPSSTASLSSSRADLAPAELRKALVRFSAFHSETGVDLRRITAFDMGDWDVAALPMEESLREIGRLVSGAFLAPVNVFIGGDNAVTRPIVRSLGVEWRNGGVLTLDAHHDVRTLDRGPTNGTPIRGLIEDGLRGDHVIQVGVHSFSNSGEYRAYCDEQGIGVRTMEDVDDRGTEEVVDEALQVLSERTEWIHVDFDIDVLDAAFAPGCPGARPGGMTPRQLARAAFLCGRHQSVVSADLVEVDPSRDRDGITVMNMAHVFLSFCAGVAAREAT